MAIPAIMQLKENRKNKRLKRTMRVITLPLI